MSSRQRGLTLSGNPETVNFPGSSTQIKIEDVLLSTPKRSDAVTVYLKHGGNISAFRFRSGPNDNGAHLWTESILPNSGDFPWFLSSDKLEAGQDILIARHPEGLRLYRVSDVGLELVKEDMNFHEVYRYDTFLLGAFFPDKKEVGLLTRNLKGELQFYSMATDSLDPDSEEDPVFPLDKDLGLGPEWESKDNQIFLVEDIPSSPSQSMIGLRGNEGLAYYRFNGDYDLEKVFTTKKFPCRGGRACGGDHVLFGDISTDSTSFKDVIHLSNGALQLHQYSARTKDYVKVLERPAIPGMESIKLLDINGDSKDDLVFTGGNGLTVMTYDPVSRSLVTSINPGDVEGAKKFSEVVGVLPTSSSSSFPRILSQDPGSFRIESSRVVEVPQRISTTTTTTTTRRPTTTPRRTATWASPTTGEVERPACMPLIQAGAHSHKPFLKWTDQFGPAGNFLKDPLDVTSGDINLSVPLVDLRILSGVNIQLTLDYSSANPSKGDMLGSGWELPLGRDYIMLNHNGFVSPRDMEFHLVLQGQPLKLKLNREEGGGDCWSFGHDKLKDMSIKYYPKKELWELEWKEGKRKRAYGGREDALQKSFQVPNWRGPGTKAGDLTPYVSSWFITSSTESRSSPTLEYKYENDRMNLPGSRVPYTSAIRLKQIKTAPGGVTVDLEYGTKPEAEYKKTELIDEKGNIREIAGLISSKYLKGISVEGPTFRQRYDFTFETKSGGNRILTGIRENGAPFLNMEYSEAKDKKWVMTRADAVNGLEANFKVKMVAPPPLKYSFNFGSSQEPELAQGQEYAVMAFPSGSQGIIEIRILSGSLSRELWRTRFDVSRLMGGGQEIKKFSVGIFSESNFVLDVGTNDYRAFFSFKRGDEEWEEVPDILGGGTFPKDAFVAYGPDFIAVGRDSGSVEIFEPDAESDGVVKWKLERVQFDINSNKRLTHFIASGHLLVGYDDEVIYLCHNGGGSSGAWTYKKLRSPQIRGHGKNIQSSIDRFDLDREVKEEVLKFLKSTMFRVYRNAIVFRSISITENALNGVVIGVLLDPNLDMASEKRMVIQREDILNLEYIHQFDGSSFTIRYESGTDGMYRAKVQELRGKVTQDLDQVRDPQLRKRHLKEMIKHINEESIDWKKFLGKLFLPNLEVHTLGVTEQGIFYGNDTMLRPTSTGWEEDNAYLKRHKDANQKISLGDEFFLLVDEEKKTLKLFDKSSPSTAIREIKPYSLDKVASRYPSYIAYQLDKDTVEFVPFRVDPGTGKGGVGRSLLLRGEELSVEKSNLGNLVTVRNGTSLAQAKELVVRPVSTLVEPKDRVVVTELKLSDSFYQTTRVTGYERAFDFDQESLSLTETLTRVPGGDKGISGWEEFTHVIDIRRDNSTRAEKLFDATGVEIQLPRGRAKIEKQAAKRKTKSNEDDRDTTKLFDVTENLLISDFSPYSTAEEMVGYFGFEEYEQNHIGDQQSGGKRWTIENGEVIPGGYPFTGDNYLQLKGINSTLTGEFLPGESTYMTYVAASWIRIPGSTLSEHETYPNFEATLMTSESFKEVIGLQSQVKRVVGEWSLLEILIDMKLFLNIVNRLEGKTNDKIKIKLRMGPPPGKEAHIDHVRFHPLSHKFEATVYDKSSQKPVAVLKANGLHTRTIYDQLGKEIAAIREDGSILHVMARNSHSAPSSLVTFEPEDGFYEEFTCSGVNERWRITNTNAWETARGQLRHRAVGSTDTISLLESAGSFSTFRFYFFLESASSKLVIQLKNGIVIRLAREGLGMSLRSSLIRSTRNIWQSSSSSSGELIMMLEEQCLLIWIDGEPVMDMSSSNQRLSSTSMGDSQLGIQVEGSVLIRDFMAMTRPQVTVEYFNAFGEKTQTIQFETCDTALVSETIYDELGREALTTKTTRVLRGNHGHLLSYREDFIVNRNSSASRVEGLVSTFNPDDGGCPFVKTVFTRDPSGREAKLGLAGPQFSAEGPYAMGLSYSGIQESLDPLLTILFPPWEGFIQRAESRPNGSVKISVFDPLFSELEVARYIKVPGYDHILTIYEYDDKGHMTKIFHPRYHQVAGTFTQKSPWSAGPQDPPEGASSFVTSFTYDEKTGNLLKKKDPDTGGTQLLYNSAGLLRFMVFGDIPEDLQTPEVAQVVYFDYDENGQMRGSGHLKRPIGVEKLRKLVNSDIGPMKEEYQQLDYFDDHPDPNTRSRVKNILTRGSVDDMVIESLVYSPQGKIEEKSAVISVPDMEGGELLTLKRTFGRMGQIESLSYGDLDLHYEYNRLGQLVRIRSGGLVGNDFGFTWTPTGQLESERYGSAHGNFSRGLHYNSPGFLDQVSDPFLTEDVSYLEEGYGPVKSGYLGDGIVTRTTFKADWTDPEKSLSDPRWFLVTPEEVKTDCFQALQNTGLISSSGSPVKEAHPLAGNSLPLHCDQEEIGELLSGRSRPSYYGHRYSYGSHQELVRAKHFSSVEEENSVKDPLTIQSLAGALNKSKTQVEGLWTGLVGEGYLVSDQHTFHGLYMAVGKKGNKSLLRSQQLFRDLHNLGPNMTLYWRPIEDFIRLSLLQSKAISKDDFETVFLKWKGLNRRYSSRLDVNRQLGIASGIWGMLKAGRYIESPLDDKFTRLVGSNSDAETLARILGGYFGNQLGTSAFDVETFDIDANGNQKLLYEGSKRVELLYKNGTNQVASVKVGTNSVPLAVLHDKRGNIIKAMHKGITNIAYHPVSQRTTRIDLEDGRHLRFWYDGAGERILKRVYESDGSLHSEVTYLRDEKGQVLLDTRRNIKEGTKVITTYLYGPRGLLGFFRDSNFFAVTTDHQGSTRLVISAETGRVVAAYDYMPYGKLMRSFGSPENGIPYLYNGKEWDEETGLYNFHARFYDPQMGRFLQPDPKAQYPSPYKYAGNSPLSFADPDGEFVFLLTCLALGAVGAYLGGAAANKSWNPVKWDYSSSKTWLGIGGGAIAGGFLPVGFAASAATIGAVATTALGVGGAYLGGAASNQNWDPTKWKWESPETWSGMFQGFGTGTGVVGGVGVAHSFAKSGTFLKRVSDVLGVSHKVVGKVFLGVSYTAGGSIAYVHGAMANNGSFAFWKWDYENPALYLGLIDGFDAGSGWPQNFMEMGRGLTKLARNPKRLIKIVGDVGEGSSKGRGLIQVLSKPDHPLYKSTLGAVMGYFMGVSANDGEMNIFKWSNSFSTYEGVLNGIFMGKDFHNLRKLAREGAEKKVPQGPQQLKVQSGLGSRAKRWANKVSQKAYKAVESALHMKAGVDLDYRRLIDNGLDPDKQMFIIKDVDSNKKLKALEDEGIIRCPGRRKRGVTLSNAGGGKSCGVKAGGVPDVADKFTENIVDFVKDNAISTERVSVVGVGDVQTFTLKQVSKNSYDLVAAKPGDPNTLEGYYLRTSHNDPNSLADPMNGKVRINVKDPEATIIFTGELQGCSIHVKHDKVTNEMEVFHRNRPPLAAMYVNSHNGKKIAERSGAFVGGYGESKKIHLEGEPSPVIPERENALFDQNANPIHATEGVIVIDQPMYYRAVEGGKLKQITHIDDTPIADLIRKNERINKQEADLKREYDMTIKWEDYLGHPANYVLLVNRHLFPRTYSTPFIYRDPVDLNWKFVSQKITYVDPIPWKYNFQVDSSTGGGPYKVPFGIETITKPLPIMTRPSSSSNPNGPRLGPIPIKPLPPLADLPEGRTFPFPSALPKLPPRRSKRSLMEERNPRQFPGEGSGTHSTTFDGGHEWMEKLDFNGILSWGVLLARKWTGYRSDEGVNSSPVNKLGITIELDVRSTDLVTKFMDSVIGQAENCEVGQAISNFLETPQSYSKAVETVRKELALGKLEQIPKILYELLMEKNKHVIISQSNITRATQYLEKIKKRLPQLEQAFLQEEQLWLKQTQRSSGASSGYSELEETRKGQDVEKLFQALANQTI